MSNSRSIELSFATPRKLPRPSDLRGKVVVLDIAFGATAHGKMRVYAQKGAPIPEGWALDADGRPTTDAKRALLMCESTTALTKVRELKAATADAAVDAVVDAAADAGAGELGDRDHDLVDHARLLLLAAAGEPRTTADPDERAADVVLVGPQLEGAGDAQLRDGQTRSVQGDPGLGVGRGQGIGHAFFDAREAHARALGGFRLTSFCAVERPSDHPARSPNWRPLDGFWQSRGYRRHDGLACTLHWREVGDAEDTPHRLAFWSRPLP